MPLENFTQILEKLKRGKTLESRLKVTKFASLLTVSLDDKSVFVKSKEVSVKKNGYTFNITLNSRFRLRVKTKLNIIKKVMII